MAYCIRQKTTAETLTLNAFGVFRGPGDTVAPKLFGAKEKAEHYAKPFFGVCYVDEITEWSPPPGTLVFVEESE